MSKLKFLRAANPHCRPIGPGVQPTVTLHAVPTPAVQVLSTSPCEHGRQKGAGCNARKTGTAQRYLRAAASLCRCAVAMADVPAVNRNPMRNGPTRFS